MKWALAVVALLTVASCAITPTSGLPPYCASEGALGVSFGPDDDDFDGETTRWVYSDDPTLAPFSEIEIVRTPLSDVVHTISGRGSFFQADVLAGIAEAERAYSELRVRIEESGMFTVRDVTQYQARYTSITSRPNDEVRLWLALSGSQVSMTCTKVSYDRQVYEELPEELRRLVDESLRRGDQRTAPQGPERDQ